MKIKVTRKLVGQFVRFDIKIRLPRNYLHIVPINELEERLPGELKKSIEDYVQRAEDDLKTALAAVS